MTGFVSRFLGNVGFKNLFTQGYIYESATGGITAGTTRTQAGATVLTKEINRVDTSTAPSAGTVLGDGVALPAAAAGLSLLVWNNTANPIQLYGVLGGTDTLNGITGATGLLMPPNSVYLVVAVATGAWAIDGPGAGASGNFPTVSAVSGLTAHSGGGQGSAVLVPAQFTRFTTVGAAGDSGILPVSAAGMQLGVANAAAVNSMNVFPAVGEQINALGANTAFALAAGKAASFLCFNAGQWHAILSA